MIVSLTAVLVDAELAASPEYRATMLCVPTVSVDVVHAAVRELPAPASGLADAEPGIVSHMNEDHGDAVQLYAGKLLGLGGSDWRMTGIDAEGIDLRQRGQVARLAFEAPLSTASEARKVLVALVGKARAV